jgi:hypothetical protein
MRRGRNKEMREQIRQGETDKEGGSVTGQETKFTTHSYKLRTERKNPRNI